MTKVPGLERVKVFALTFALGVVSGVTMSFQFGTNWPGFIERAGYDVP